MTAQTPISTDTALPVFVKRAIKSGPVPEIRDLSELTICKPGEVFDRSKHMTKGEQVIDFAERFLPVPEGPKVGQPLQLHEYQKCFILAVVDNPVQTSQAICSIARRNGKTFLIGVILLAFIVGPLKEQNTTLCSAAMSRDQASAVFELMIKMLDLSEQIKSGVHYKYTESSKSIRGLKKNVQYKAISSDAKTGHGKAYKIILLDEAGQIEAESNPFVEMLESSQSNYDDAMFFIVSTQAPSDASYLSIQIDHAEVAQDNSLVCHVYASDPEKDLLDVDEWYASNPGLGVFRSLKEMKKKAETAKELPSKANGIMNLNFNMRISLAAVFMSPEVWKRNLRPVNTISRFKAPIDIGLDLSIRTDLTAAVASWRDEETGEVNVETHCFAPSVGVEQREIRDKVPYRRWAKEGWLNLVPGEIVTYEWVAKFLAIKFENCEIRSVQFDRYRIDLFKESAKKTDLYGMVGTWEQVGQGFISMGIRCEAFEAEALEGRLRTGPHPMLNMSASQAIAVQDPAGNRKLMKNKSIQRIDPMIAALMAVYPNSEGVMQAGGFDADALIG